MSIRSTAFMIQSQTGELGILCYRGTEPVNAQSWLTNIDVYGREFPFAHSATPGASVHAGFYRNVEGTFPTVLEALRNATQGKSILTGKKEAGALKPLKKLYITGHSLGGAMAVLAAAMLKGGAFPAFTGIDGERIPVYTFGQPMVGNGAFAENSEKLAFDLHRYVYRRDIVPRLPSADAKGDFQHFGTPVFFGYPGDQEKVPPSADEAQEILAQTAANLLGNFFRAWVENMFEGQHIFGPAEKLVSAVGDAAEAVRQGAIDTVERGMNAVEWGMKHLPWVGGDGSPVSANAQQLPKWTAKGVLPSDWPKQALSILDVLLAANVTILEKFRANDGGNLFCSLADHAPNFYIDAIKPKGSNDRFQIPKRQKVHLGAPSKSVPTASHNIDQA
jgi:hypothetical protein